MPNPSATLKEVEEALRNVIENLIDGQDGFKKIGEELKDQTLRDYFFAESLQRAQFRGDLETVLHQEGVHDIKESGTAAGAVMRVWGSLKHSLGGGDHALLETAVEAEDEAQKAYENALNRELPLPIRQLLQGQLAHIELAYDYAVTARDLKK
jgi:uncharacterized protein (TIGR02284 family)